MATYNFSNVIGCAVGQMSSEIGKLNFPIVLIDSPINPGDGWGGNVGVSPNIVNAEFSTVIDKPANSSSKNFSLSDGSTISIDGEATLTRSGSNLYFRIGTLSYRCNSDASNDKVMATPIITVIRGSNDVSAIISNSMWRGSSTGIVYQPCSIGRPGYATYSDFLRSGGSGFSSSGGPWNEETLSTVNEWLDVNTTTPSTDPYSDIDGLGEITGGGTGTVGIPGFPPISATSTGILGLFAPSTSEMQQLSDYMWTDFGGTGTTEVDVLKEIVQALKRTISNPLDYVTGLSIIPSQGLSIGSSQVIKFGFTSSGVSMPRLSSQYFTVDCGSINFDALCGDTFLDYAPYSKFSIYLPYIGCKTLDANDCVGHTIGVVYHGDVVTGGVTAYVTKDGSVMYQYSGCCSLNIPLSSDSWGTTISGAVQVATSMIASASTPGVAGVAKTAIAGASNVASNPSMLSPQVQHSGAISGGAGCMGVQYPYIIREAVRFHSTQNFNSEHGYPSYYYRKLSSVSGFTIVYDTHIDGINATNEEISEIEDLLKSGVIL